MLESLALVKHPSRQKQSAAGFRAKRPEAVPLLDLSRQYLAIRQDVLVAIERVCASQHFILGEEVAAFEQEVASVTGATSAVACASGTDALWLALIAVGIQPGDAVLTSAFSFFASASAIARAGARPVFADVDPDTLNLDAGRARAKLETSRPDIRALLPVHLYGQCADMDALQKLAEEFKVPIIEDAAQAIGAAWRGRRAGSLGLAAAFSFYPTKNLSAYGDAGLVTTSNVEYAEHMRHLRNHGSAKRYYHDEFGANSRLDAIQAAILRVKLPYLDEWNSQRQARAAIYERLFRESGLVDAKGSSPVRLLHTPPHSCHVFHQYVICAKRRDELRKFLTERKIGTEIYYPVPLHLQDCFAYLGYRERDLPEAELAAREVLALPMFPELTEDEQGWVAESIADFYS